ncbi:MAG: glycosyltransferase family 2 protein [Patescibacteria group bacterium]
MGKIEKISVIIPTYNRPQFLKKAISSVQTQTYKHLEIIVSDDGSEIETENLVKGLQKKDQRIIYLKNKHTGLPAVTRNHGLKLATGSLVSFLDDDDQWLKNKLKIQLATLKTKNADFISTNAQVLKTNKTYFPTSQTYQLNLNNLLKNNVVINSSVLVKTKIIKNLRFNENKNLRATEDYDLWLKIASLGLKMVYLPQPLIIYRDDPSNSIRNNSLSQQKVKLNLFISIFLFNLKKLYLKNLIIILINGLKLL